MPTGDPTPFTHRESVIAARVGCTKAFIRDFRKTRTPGEDWDFGPNKVILWSQAGLEALAEAWVKTASPPPHSDATAALPEPPAQKILRVTRSNFPNRKVLQATTPDGESVVVRHVQADRFFPGMLILARKSAGAVWDFEGNPAAPQLGRRFPRNRRDNQWPRATPHHEQAAPTQPAVEEDLHGEDPSPGPRGSGVPPLEDGGRSPGGPAGTALETSTLARPLDEASPGE